MASGSTPSRSYGRKVPSSDFSMENAMHDMADISDAYDKAGYYDCCIGKDHFWQSDDDDMCSLDMDGMSRDGICYTPPSAEVYGRLSPSTHTILEAGIPGKHCALPCLSPTVPNGLFTSDEDMGFASCVPVEQLGPERPLHTDASRSLNQQGLFTNVTSRKIRKLQSPRTRRGKLTRPGAQRRNNVVHLISI